ncbi:hypothetical protein [Streptomyces sp. NBC_00057]|uniref:hypothetical protein n=1 Tax=Streptomyces sp. NBC_00057 TaxID=2975634 RepID=UPI0032559515
MSVSYTETGLNPARAQGHPLSAAQNVREGYFASRLNLPGTADERLATVLTSLPEPDRPRADPRYRLLALRARD